MAVVPDYRIVCTKQEPSSATPSHQHIVAVGTGTDPEQANESWDRQKVVEYIQNGWATFHTIGTRTGIRAKVIAEWCGSCGHYIIKSVGDVTTDNNLDYLRRCSWA